MQTLYLLVFIFVLLAIFSKKFRGWLIGFAVIAAFGFVLLATGLPHLGDTRVQTSTDNTAPVKDGDVAYVPVAPAVPTQNRPPNQPNQPNQSTSVQVIDVQRNGNIVVEQGGQTITIPPTFGPWGQQQNNR